MMTLPDVNEMLKDLNGSLFPLGFLKLLLRLWGGLSGRPTVNRMRVPLMGVKREFQASRLASQLAFMMIEHIRREAVALFGASRAEIGWVAEDNRGMVSIAETIDSSVNRVYRVYEQNLERPSAPSPWDHTQCLLALFNVKPALCPLPASDYCSERIAHGTGPNSTSLLGYGCRLQRRRLSPISTINIGTNE